MTEEINMVIDMTKESMEKAIAHLEILLCKDGKRYNDTYQRCKFHQKQILEFVVSSR